MLKVIYRNLNNAADAVRENGGYCPCKLDKCPENKCTCQAFKDQVVRKELGYCDCGLFELIEDSNDGE